MPNDNEAGVPSRTANLTLEEYKELGNEYRYRDQLMVQEFGLSMAALGVVATNLWRMESAPFVQAAVLVISAVFLFILGSHLSNVNEDRRAALNRREKLREELGFKPFHLGAEQKRRSAPLIRSAPRLMIWFVWGLLVAWTIWAGIVATALMPSEVRDSLAGLGSYIFYPFEYSTHLLTK